MSKVLIFIIILLVSLSLGAIGVGIYIANFRSKPQNKNRDFSVATVTLIMVTSLLMGLLIFAIYYGLTYEPEQVKATCNLQDSEGKPCCPTCGWGPDDIKALVAAEQTFDTLQNKVNVIPRDMSYRAKCDSDPSGAACGIKTRGGMPKPQVPETPAQPLAGQTGPAPPTDFRTRVPVPRRNELFPEGRGGEYY
jgi:hypothetical protein